MPSGLVVAGLLFGQHIQEREVEVGEVAALELLAAGAGEAGEGLMEDVDAELAQLSVRLRGDPVRARSR
eukprot:1969083-Pyramimonas_sp.AAC.1